MPGLSRSSNALPRLVSKVLSCSHSLLRPNASGLWLLEGFESIFWVPRVTYVTWGHASVPNPLGPSSLIPWFAKGPKLLGGDLVSMYIEKQLHPWPCNLGDNSRPRPIEEGG